jgi:hypothetical protein
MIVCFVIGVHQSLYHGVANSYWLFMLSSLAFLWLNHRMKSRKPDPGVPTEATSKTPKKKKK